MVKTLADSAQLFLITYYQLVTFSCLIVLDKKHDSCQGYFHG